MRRQIVCWLFSVLAVVLSFSSSAKECARIEAFTAETFTNYLSSWQEVHAAFKEFGHCDDGAIAEGFVEKISLLWADRWGELSEMIERTESDPNFNKFVYKKVGSEAIPLSRWKQITHSAQTNCPDGAEEFCKYILSRASLSSGSCLSWAPQEISIKGSIRSEMDGGSYLALYPSTPSCVTGYERLGTKPFSKIQLLTQGKEAQQQLSAFVNKDVICNGSLIDAKKEGHHTLVLMQVKACHLAK